MVLLLGARFQLCCFASLGVYLFGIDHMPDSGWNGQDRVGWRMSLTELVLCVVTA